MKDFFESFDLMSSSELDKLINKLMDEEFNTQCEKETESLEENDKTVEHVSLKSKEYENGKLTKKCDKEYVNGKCVKDECYDARSKKRDRRSPKTINFDSVVCDKDTADESKENFTNNPTTYEKKIGWYEQENKELEKKVSDYKNQISEMTRYIDGLNDYIKRLSNEKDELQKVVDNIKNCL